MPYYHFANVPILTQLVTQASGWNKKLNLPSIPESLHRITQFYKSSLCGVRLGTAAPARRFCNCRLAFHPFQTCGRSNKASASVGDEKQVSLEAAGNAGLNLSLSDLKKTESEIHLNLILKKRKQKTFALVMYLVRACFLQMSNPPKFIYKTETDTKRGLSSFCRLAYVYKLWCLFALLHLY